MIADSWNISDLKSKIAVLRKRYPDREISKQMEKNVAAILGLTPSAWARVGRGKQKVHAHHLHTILDEFGVTDHGIDIFLLDENEFAALFSRTAESDKTSILQTGYKQKLIENFKLRRAPDRTVDIATSYYSLTLKRNSPSGKKRFRIPAMQAMHDQRIPRLCILGPSGFGKTACLRRYLWEIREQEHVPFVLSVRSFANQREREQIDVESWFARSVEGYSLPKEELRILLGMIKKREGVYLIDGIDNLRSDIRFASNVLTALETFFAGSKNCRIIITTRIESDLLGHFADFETFSLEQIPSSKYIDFLNTLDYQSEYNIDQKIKKLGFRSSPFLILTAAAFISNTEQNTLTRIDNSYKMLKLTIDQLLQKEGDYDSDHSPSRMMSFDVRNIRNLILDKIIEGPEPSNKPVRISKEDLFDIMLQAVREISPESEALFPDNVSLFNFLIPTGICLELSHDYNDKDSFIFVHDMVQEFLYARKLLRSVASGEYELLRSEYYSPDILMLFGEGATDEHVDILLEWVSSPEMDVMIRKVAAGALGFVVDETRQKHVLNRLERLFEHPGDIGVDGRLAESIRRLGGKRATERFIERLDCYEADRKREVDPSRPLTFEIDVPFESPLPQDVVTILKDKLFHSENVVTRKHALILLIRSEPRLPLSMLVRYCVNECNALISALCENAARKTPETIHNSSAHVRSLRYGIEGLCRVGSDVEVEFLNHMRGVLREFEQRHMLATLEKDIDDACDVRIGHRKWPRLHFTASGNDGTSSRCLYLVRHGESQDNLDQRFAGSTNDSGLSVRGAAQAIAVSERLKELTASCSRFEESIIVSSAAGRSMETAAYIANCLGVELIKDPDLIELDMGAWSGVEKNDLLENDRARFLNWKKEKFLNAPPGGESLFEVKSRICNAVSNILRNHFSRMRHVIIVSHYFPIKSINKQIVGDWKLEPINCAISHFTWNDGGFSRVVANDIKHLEDVGFDKVDYV